MATYLERGAGIALENQVRVGNSILESYDNGYDDVALQIYLGYIQGTPLSGEVCEERVLRLEDICQQPAIASKLGENADDIHFSIQVVRYVAETLTVRSVLGNPAEVSVSNIDEVLGAFREIALWRHRVLIKRFNESREGEFYEEFSRRGNEAQGNNLYSCEFVALFIELINAPEFSMAASGKGGKGANMKAITMYMSSLTDLELTPEKLSDLKARLKKKGII